MTHDSQHLPSQPTIRCTQLTCAWLSRFHPLHRTLIAAPSSTLYERHPQTKPFMRHSTQLALTCDHARGQHALQVNGLVNEHLARKVRQGDNKGAQRGACVCMMWVLERDCTAPDHGAAFGWIQHFCTARNPNGEVKVEGPSVCAAAEQLFMTPSAEVFRTIDSGVVDVEGADHAQHAGDERPCAKQSTKRRSHCKHGSSRAQNNFLHWRGAISCLFQLQEACLHVMQLLTRRLTNFGLASKQSYLELYRREVADPNCQIRKHVGSLGQERQGEQETMCNKHPWLSTWISVPT